MSDTLTLPREVVERVSVALDAAANHIAYEGSATALRLVQAATAARIELRAALAVPHVQPSGAAVPVGLPAGEQTGPVAAAPTHLPPLPPPYRPATIANRRNTASVRNSFEMGGYEKSPALFTADQMDAYAREAVAAALATPQPQPQAEPVAWMWEYIGCDPMRDHLKPCARSPHEMDPHNPPYPESWRPVYPLYRR